MEALQATCSLPAAAALVAWVPSLARAATEPPLEPLPAAVERRPGISQAQLVQGELVTGRQRLVLSLGTAEDPSAIASDSGQPSDSTLLPLLRELGAAQLKGLRGAGLLLVERGDRAVLVIEEADGLRSWINFRCRDGVWQIGEPPVLSARGLAG